MITITGNKGLMKIKGQHSVWIEPKQGMCKMHIRVYTTLSFLKQCIDTVSEMVYIIDNDTVSE